MPRGPGSKEIDRETALAFFGEMCKCGKNILCCLVCRVKAKEAAGPGQW